MGKNLSKSDLLAEIAHERRLLKELISQVPRNLFNRQGINSAGWSIKDVLTHLNDWELRVVRWCEVGISGEVPDMPEKGYKWNQIRELNAAIQKKHARKSIKKVLQEFDEVHEESIRLVNGFTDQQLTTLNYYEWTGKSWTVSDYIRSNTASHYRWARNKIRKWLKACSD
ncbi:MAG: ClbS/DfsB family four-helix bundle protein [Planctomycetota bacterium]